MRNSDVRDFNVEAKKVIQHFEKVRERDIISDEYHMHVFKAAMLLIAVVSGSNVSNLYSKQRTRNRIIATRNTLYKLFRGQLAEEQVDFYLNTFEEIGILRLDQQPNGDARLEMPYTGNYDLFDGRLDATKKKYTRHQLFVKSTNQTALLGAFSRTIEGYLWDSTKATFNRMYIAACASETKSLTTRLAEVKSELAKFPHKIGLLVVSISTASDFSLLQTQVKKIASEDTSKRLVVALLKEPCTDEILDRWHRAITHKELSAEDAKKSSETQYEGEAAAEIAKWCASASEGQIYVCYGDAVFPSLYGKDDLVKRVENDVLYTAFPAAIERIVFGNTAFKKGNGSAIYALTDEKSNQQVSQIINNLRSINAWDINDLDELAALSGDKSITVTELAKFIREQFEQGAKIPLDNLWATLQQPPFGYYNSIAAEVFIGLALRSFLKGSAKALFNWIDHQNNTNEPTGKNLASMINKMINGQTVNNYLSSGSAIWQKFKPYVKMVFGLKDSECVNETEARKYMLVRISGFGVPFWSLKYVPADKLGGDDAKSVICDLTDAFCDFIYTVSDDQESVMDTVLTLFNGRGGLKKVISETITNKTFMFAAFKGFIFEECPDLQSLHATLGLSDKDLIDNIRNYLQIAVNTWREGQVKDELVKLSTELLVVATLNSALGISEKTYTSLQAVLNNRLEYMKIPGTV